MRQNQPYDTHWDLAKTRLDRTGFEIRFFSFRDGGSAPLL